MRGLGLPMQGGPLDADDTIARLIAGKGCSLLKDQLPGLPRRTSLFSMTHHRASVSNYGVEEGAQNL